MARDQAAFEEGFPEVMEDDAKSKQYIGKKVLRQFSQGWVRGEVVGYYRAPQVDS
jgi:hypothetical protein